MSLLMLGVQLLGVGTAAAVGFNPTDVSVDLVAAGPFTYDHLTLAGTGPNLPRYDSRTINKTTGVVESLEGGDFACGDLVIFFGEVTIDASATGSGGTVQLDMSFLSEPTGQPGAGFDDIRSVGISTNDSLAGGGNANLDGNETVTLIDEHDGVTNSKSARLGTVVIANLDPGDVLVYQAVGHLGCDPGSSPTGNLQVAITDGRIDGARIGVGNQTIPFKKIEDLAQPGLNVVKTCPASAAVGQSITYQITLSNSGNETLNNITVQDTILGNLSGSFADTLAATASETGSFQYTIKATDPDPIVNTVTVNAVGATSGVTVTATDNCTTSVPPPPPPPEEGVAVQITKDNDANNDGIYSNNEEAKKDDLDVPFRLVIQNTGELAFTITSLTDSFEQTVLDLLATKCASLVGVTVAPGDKVTCFFTLNNYSPPQGTSIDDVAEVCVEDTTDGSETDCDDDPSRVRSAVVLGTTVTPTPTNGGPPPTRTPPGGIAFTGPGAETIGLGLLAIALLVLGMGLLWAGNRKREGYER